MADPEIPENRAEVTLAQQKAAEKSAKAVARAKAWNAANPEKVRAKNAAYRAANREKVNAASAAWGAANRERVRANEKAWKAANVEKVRGWVAAWAAANQDRIKLSRQARDAANPERKRAVARAYRAANPETVRANHHLRRARKRNAEGKYTGDDIKALFSAQGGKCGYCRKSIKKLYHIDHIKSLAVGGSNWPCNLQLLCPKCNFAKCAKDPIEFARELGMLL